MNIYQFRALLRRYGLGQADKEEVDAVEKWYEKLGSAPEEESQADQQEQIKRRIWQKIDSKIPKRHKGREVLSSHQAWWLKVAATILLLAGIFSYGLWQWSRQRPEDSMLMNIKMNTGKQPLLIQLSDSSQVSLEPGSFLRYPEHFSGAKREVYLTGEAFFNIKRQPEHPFFVITDNIITKVLGTSFRVKAYGDKSDVSVTVQTGKVSVFQRQDDKAPTRELPNTVVLTPNQKAVFYTADAQLVKTLADEPMVVMYTDDGSGFEFDSTPLPTVFNKLEQSYGIHFIFDKAALANCTITARLKNESLYEKLALISEVTHLSYEIIDGQIVIEGQGCVRSENTQILKSQIKSDGK